MASFNLGFQIAIDAANQIRSSLKPTVRKVCTNNGGAILRQPSNPPVRRICVKSLPTQGFSSRPQLDESFIKNVSWQAAPGVSESRWHKNNWTPTTCNNQQSTQPAGENVMISSPIRQNNEPTDNSSMNMLVNDPNSSMWQLHRETFHVAKQEVIPTQTVAGGIEAHRLEDKNVKQNIQDYYKARWEQENETLNNETAPGMDHVNSKLPESIEYGKLSKRQPLEDQKPLQDSKFMKFFSSKQRAQPKHSTENIELGLNTQMAPPRSKYYEAHSKRTPAESIQNLGKNSQKVGWKQSISEENENLQKSFMLFKGPSQNRQTQEMESGKDDSMQPHPIWSKQNKHNISDNYPLSQVKAEEDLGASCERNYMGFKSPIFNFKTEPSAFPFKPMGGNALEQLGPEEVTKRLFANRVEPYSTYSKDKLRQAFLRNSHDAQSKSFCDYSTNQQGGCSSKPCQSNWHPKVVRQFINKLSGYQWHQSFEQPACLRKMHSCRSITTCSSCCKDPCVPPPLPAASLPCERKAPKRPKCEIKKQEIKWPPCEKICLPCCPPTALKGCNEDPVFLKSCQKTEYRIPAFSECKRDPLAKLKKKECCYEPPKPCPLETIGGKSPFTSVKTRTDRILGRQPPQDPCKKNFSTSSSTNAGKKDEEECKKATSELPCVKPSDVLGAKKKDKQSKKDCEKLCMPCCPPARSPPECYYPYIKPPCKKMKPPRPAYSECKSDPVQPLQPCECAIPRAPPCEKGGKKGKKGSKCMSTWSNASSGWE